jgi:ADP-ribose pyrophosphatase YjhB (NUDIX family)
MHKIVIEHHIQRDILQRLAGGPLRFTDLKPKGMESNIFVYHTGILRNSGLIEKSGEMYRLAPAGLRYVDQLSAATFKPRVQPKGIAVLVVHSPDGEVVLLRRVTEPYLGQLMLPSGKMHFGETLAGHAVRELYEKTGLQAELHYSGLANIKISHSGQAITHVLAVVWQAQLEDKSTLHCDDLRFEAVWSGSAHGGMMPGTQELIMESQQDGRPFMVDLDVTDA